MTKSYLPFRWACEGWDGVKIIGRERIRGLMKQGPKRYDEGHFGKGDGNSEDRKVCEGHCIQMEILSPGTHERGPHQRVLSTELCPPTPNSYVEALTSNVSVFGHRDFKEIIKVK